MQYCTANAFRCCLPAATVRTRVSLFWTATNSFVHLFMNFDTVAFHHCVPGKSWVWLFLLGLAPFAFWFVSLPDGEAQIWLGDLRFASCGWFFGFVFVLDLPSYMTTGVYVDVILTASSHVRTEPQSVIGHTRGKKNLLEGFSPRIRFAACLSPIRLPTALMTAWGCCVAGRMPWTMQQCSEWCWPVQHCSLLYCIGRPRAAKDCSHGSFWRRYQLILAPLFG